MAGLSGRTSSNTRSAISGRSASASSTRSSASALRTRIIDSSGRAYDSRTGRAIDRSVQHHDQAPSTGQHSPPDHKAVATALQLLQEVVLTTKEAPPHLQEILTKGVQLLPLQEAGQRTKALLTGAEILTRPLQEVALQTVAPPTQHQAEAPHLRAARLVEVAAAEALVEEVAVVLAVAAGN